MSATLSDDVETLKGLILHNPVHVKLEEAEEELESRLSQFYLLSNDEEEKFLHLYTLLKFKLLPGKALIFVNDIDQCYRLKLFLDRFSIRVAVLNADLPLGARLHIVNQFSRGVFDYLIATDDSISEEEEAAALDSSHKGKGKPKGKGKKRPSVHAARGIDFRDVESVVLFDLPRTVIEYVHRIGRTARAGASGSAVTLIAKEERDSFDAIYRAVEEGGREIRPFAINTEEADAFRYRVGDAYRSVTKLQIKEARATDLKREILQAAKMNQEVDSSNTDALDALKHDAPIPTTRSFSHLKNVPSYLNPTGLVMSETAMIVQQTAAANEARKRERLERTVTYAKPSKRPRTGGQAKRGPSGKRRDPLKSMK
jgi:ATP-dependent RNA helicase DDX56/DBP9